MSIVTFENDDREQTGRTLTTVAVATRMAIERNFRILIMSTSYNDATLKNCFWKDTVQKKLKIYDGRNLNLAVENGIEGLTKLITANKISPSIITDYTKVIFKDRLEILNGYTNSIDTSGEETNDIHKKLATCYPELIRLASQYYDMVLVDVDKHLSPEVKKEISEIADVNVLVMTQRLSSLDKYNELKNRKKEVIGPKYIPVIGKYNKESKYNKKNIIRYLDEKKDISLVPMNTLYFEAAEEASVAELFLKLRDIKDTSDDNYFFMDEVLKLTDIIIKRLKDLKMKMG